jgi:hypothetical protein
MQTRCSNQDCRKLHDLKPGYCLECRRAYQRQRNAKRTGPSIKRNPLKQRFYRIKYKYGLSPQDYQRLIEKQHSKCAGCGIDLKSLRLDQTHVDHCHDTSIVRGILCGSCNRALGLMQDDPVRLQGLTNYAKLIQVIKATTSSSNSREKKK